MPYSLKDTQEPPRCLQCGSVILYGRRGRKFCCVGCKNRYHNQRNYPIRGKTASEVLRILENNRAILAKLIHLGVRTVDRTTLDSLGFDAGYMTTFHKTRTRSVYSCLDIRYEMTPSRVKNIGFLWEGAENDKTAF